MTEVIKQSLRDSKTARWIVLLIVSFAMLTAYMFMEILSPLKTMIQNAYGWDNGEWGIVTGAQGYLNVFALMLIVGGIVLDKMGVRFTAVASAVVMLLGAIMKYYAIKFISPSDTMHFILWDIKSQVFWAASGFAIFCVGAETAGITVSKILVKWFKGKELALSMGLEMASARLGSALALFGSPRIAEAIDIPTPVFISGMVILIGLILFIIYTFMDAKLDKEYTVEEDAEEFKISDLKHILTNPGFWYIAVLCVLFYSAVFPFYKYGPDLMVNKYGVDPGKAGDIPGWLPIGTMLLTPLFGMFYDRRGKGASMMIMGAVLLIVVHLIYWSPALTSVSMAYVAVIILGVAFSLVPSAMWPSVPKIIEDRYLGSAYALIFFIQNIGLMVIPILIGRVLDIMNPGVGERLDTAREAFRATGLTAGEISEKMQALRLADTSLNYDYTNTWLIFVALTFTALILAIMLKRQDKRSGYGLELPNIAK